MVWKAGKEIKDEKGNFIDHDWDESLKDIGRGFDEEDFMGFKGFKKYFGTNRNGVEETFKDNRIEARLTIEGLDYAIELKRETEKHTFLKATGTLSTLFALTAAIMSIANFFKPHDKVPPPQAQVIIMPTQQTQTLKLPDSQINKPFSSKVVRQKGIN